MGVPKFFRYISERYPCLSELAREQCIPEFDNLYLDMNGIIHSCSHPDDGNINFSISEEEMFKDIFNYIEKLFFLIKPQKIFFLAVDGVAPRAKMNQQRSRRFRSAKDAEILEEKAKVRGEFREQERFDSNCITPGTEFMSRLHEALRCFIKRKISTDQIWKKCRIILSGHNFPGEGEHKIMDYIRFLKSQPDYNSITRHCLYGLDADLIILGLCTHQMHFVVLREEVKFGRKTKRTSVEETRFFLLHLGLLREYLEMEFQELRLCEPQFNIAKLIDDWILMGFLVGNDFVPHLPLMHINKNALPLLYKTYIKVYPTLGGNINENGKLNLERLEKYFGALAEVEYEIFVQNNDNLRSLETNNSKNGVDEAFDFEVSEIKNENIDNELEAFIESSRQFFEDDALDSSDEDQQLAEEFETYKRNYYMDKFDHNEVSSTTKLEQAICYITALQWILDYYYRGVQSWDWYYPYHYAPFISDLKNFKSYKIEFNMGKPFLPFEQLLAVLPSASKDLLPPAYRDLMTSSNSELIDFYPNDFKTDLNGKQHEWEAVVLIPFINENKLLQAMKKCENNLTNEEKSRNRHGPMIQFDHCAQSQGSVAGAYSLSALTNVYCTEKFVWAKDIAVNPEKALRDVVEHSGQSIFFPGFPTMKHLNYKFKITPARIKVFEQNSRNESLILLLEARPEFCDAVATAEKCLNQIVFIGWPHLIKSIVVAVSNREFLIDNEGTKSKDEKIYLYQRKEAEFHLKTRMGIELSDFSVLLHVKTYVGTSYRFAKNGKISKVDMWSETTTTYPAQGVVTNLYTYNWKQDIQYNKVEDLFPVNSTVFFIGNPYYGSEGTVLDPLKYYEYGRLSVRITVHSKPDFQEAKEIQNLLDSDYVNSYEAAIRLNLSVKCLARVTGSILVVSGIKRKDLPENLSKINIGLQMRYPKQREERAGYTRRINNQWFYSSKALEIVQDYYEKYPMVFSYLNSSSEKNDICFESDIFPDYVGERVLENVAAWVKSLDHMQSERIPNDSKTLGKEAILKILNVVENLEALPKKTVKLQVKPYLLLKPDVTLPDVYKSKQPIKLFDRVVIVKTTYMVPIGSKGTVVGIHPVTDPNPVRLECVKSVENFYEILFDADIPNGNNIHGIAQQRVYKVPESSILLIYVKDLNFQQTNEETSDSCELVTVMQQKHKNFNDYSIASSNAQKQTFVSAPPIRSGHVKTNSAFWIPAADTKLKHENSIPYSIEGQPMPPHTPSVNSSVETQTLKNLLGLSIQSNVADEDRQNLKTINSRKLPQPPPNWKNDAQNVFAPTQEQHIRKTHNEQSVPSVQLRSIPYSNNFVEASTREFYSPNSFNGRVDCSQKSNTENPVGFIPSQSFFKNGSFIPLQAQRASQNQAKQSQRPLNMRQSMEKQTKWNNSSSDAAAVESKDQYEKNVNRSHKRINENKRPQRVSKVAAKFDLMD